MDVANKLPLAASAIEVANKEHLEQYHWIYCRTTIVGAVKVFYPLPDKTKIDDLVYFAQQVILGNQFLNAHKLHANLSIVLFS